MSSGVIGKCIVEIENIEAALYSYTTLAQKTLSIRNSSIWRALTKKRKEFNQIAALVQEVKLLLLRENQEAMAREKASKELRDILERSEIASHPEVEKALDELSGKG